MSLLLRRLLYHCSLLMRNTRTRVEGKPAKLKARAGATAHRGSKAGGNHISSEKISPIVSAVRLAEES